VVERLLPQKPLIASCGQGFFHWFLIKQYQPLGS